jgi:C4-dicarboxylate-specific signal transduction histidine kinase
MLVKTRLRINITVSVVSTLAIVAVLLLALDGVRRAVEESSIAAGLITCAFERNTLRNDYLRTESERAKRQWFAKNRQMETLLTSASEKFRDAEDQKIIQELSRDNIKTGQIFAVIVANRTKLRPPGTDAAALSREAENRLVSQMTMRVYDRALYAVALEEGARRRLYSALRQAAGAIACVTLVAAAAATSLSWNLSRTITNRLERLRKGAFLIGDGNLLYRIETGDGDEFAELSQGFNAMTVKLQASHLELENEIVERKAVEGALGRLNEELEMRVAQRTEQLQESQVELETQNAQLQEAYQEQEEQSELRIRILEDLRIKEQLLIQQSRMAAMGEMLINVSHQWRQPLNVLGMKVQELGLTFKYGDFSEKMLDDSTREVMEIIQGMSQTISDFQDFLAPDQEKRAFRVDEAIRKTVALLEDTFKKQSIGLDISSAQTPLVNGYPNAYGQAVMNLLNNARDAFLERGVADAVITVRTWGENGRAVATITDNAGGIREEILDRVFDAYFTTKELGKGTGVGLFLAKTIIEKNMGGRLSVRNVAGGCEFRIEV